MKKLRISILVLCVLVFCGCGSESQQFLEKAEEYFAEKKYDHAAYNYVRALETDRENKTVYLQLIDCYAKLERYEDAWEYLEEAEAMFGLDTLEESRAVLEKLSTERAPESQTTPTPESSLTKTPTPEITATPLPEVTVVPTEKPAAAITIVPTEKPAAVITVVPTEKPAEVITVVPTEKPMAVITSAPKYTFSNVYAEMYVTTELNVRTEPSVNGDVIGVLEPDTKVEILRRCNETGWYELLYNGEAAYSHSAYLSKEPRKDVTGAPCQPTAIPEPSVTSKPLRVTLRVPDLSEELSYYSGEGELLSKIQVSGITYQYVASGMGWLNLYFSGEKTYDSINGENECGLVWVLYDGDGKVVDSSVMRLNGLHTGDCFEGELAVAEGVIEGLYHLELFSVGTKNYVAFYEELW